MLLKIWLDQKYFQHVRYLLPCLLLECYEKGRGDPMNYIRHKNFDTFPMPPKAQVEMDACQIVTRNFVFWTHFSWQWPGKSTTYFSSIVCHWVLLLAYTTLITYASQISLAQLWCNCWLTWRCVFVMSHERCAPSSSLYDMHLRWYVYDTAVMKTTFVLLLAYGGTP